MIITGISVDTYPSPRMTSRALQLATRLDPIRPECVHFMSQSTKESQ
jgi:hypothetical protein